MPANLESRLKRSIHARKLFADKLSELHDDLNRSSIDYRIIGSVAFTALATHAGYNVELDFNRRGAITPDQCIPDIDLIFPRTDTNKVQELREKFGSSSNFPIKLGLAAVAQTFDLRPNDEESYLTHKRLIVPFSTAVLNPEVLTFDDHNFIGLSPLALANTYGTVGGLIRKKDASRIELLSQIHGSNPMTDANFLPFREFNTQRTSQYPYYTTANRAYSFVDEHAPRIIANSIKAAALPVATIFKLR